MTKYTKHIISHIAGSIIGIGVGILVMGKGFELLVTLYNQSCPGTTCGYPHSILIAITGTMGGIIGAAIGYTITQRLRRDSIKYRQLSGFAFLGAFLWPVLGLSSTLCLTFYLMTSWHSQFDFLSQSSAYYEIYEWVVSLAIFITLPGVLLGIFIASVRDLKSE